MSNYNNCPSCQARQMQHMPYNRANNQANYRDRTGNNYPACTEVRQCDYDRQYEEMSSFPENYSYAMAYIAFQQFDSVYPYDKAICQGTLFPCLDMPWMIPTRGCIR